MVVIVDSVSKLDLCLPAPPTCKAEYQSLIQTSVPDAQVNCFVSSAFNILTGLIVVAHADTILDLCLLAPPTYKAK